MIIVTGSGGLVGSAIAERFLKEGYEVVGIDNDTRASLFGEQASVFWRWGQLKQHSRYTHLNTNILHPAFPITLANGATSREKVEAIFHCAAQPSHDWAAQDPIRDFELNARATLIMLEFARKHCPEAQFVHWSTNKVYGDRPNKEVDVEIKGMAFSPKDRRYHYGIDEGMSVDQSLHSLFGASKLAADITAQEYARYFGMNVYVFRGGCLTGPDHGGAELHGFLSYLVKCAITATPYTVYGYDGYQVRDNVHSDDLAELSLKCLERPGSGVFNIGGGPQHNISVNEAIHWCGGRTGRVMDRKSGPARIGDHRWYVSDIRRAKEHFGWEPKITVTQTLEDIFDGWKKRLDL